MKYAHPDDLQKSGELLEQHFRGESHQYEFEPRMKHKNGKWVWILDRGKVVSWTDDGKPLWMFGTHLDITESRNLKAQLIQSQKIESIGQLAGGLAHDFNNILSIINSYSCLIMMETHGDCQVSEYLQKIILACGRAAELTYSMLAFSRTQIMKLEQQNLNIIVAKFGDFVKRIIGANIQVTINTTDTPLIVNVDRGQIEQILINFANNARDAMPKGGSLTFTTDILIMDDKFISANGFGKPGYYAVIMVADTGTGIDKNFQEKIFEPFFTTKEVGKGTGLGLAMVFGIVAQHKGYVNLSSEPGSGTTFLVYLPFDESDIVFQDISKDTAKGTVSGNETIMIVEDNADLREVMHKFLAIQGYKVIVATDGLDALDKFKANQDSIKLIVTDMIMPRMSGKIMYDEIRQIKPDMKALFSSGYSAKIIEDQGKLGVNADFMAKPIQPDILLKTVREMLDRPVK